MGIAGIMHNPLLGTALGILAPFIWWTVARATLGCKRR